MCMYNMCVLGTPKEQKRTLNFLELELWMVASHSWVLGMGHGSFARATNALKHCAFSKALHSIILVTNLLAYCREKNLTR